MYRCASLYICVCGRVSDGCVGGCAVSVYACACMCTNVLTFTVYIYESEQRVSKEREPAGGEEKTERESRLIGETRMSKGRNCQPGCETDSRLSSSGG